MGRFMSKDGAPEGTSDAAAAMMGADGKPVANALRNTAFQASALRTSLLTSVMAFGVTDLVLGLGALILALGLAVAGVGVALAGLAIPAFSRKFHVAPVAVNA
jgi:CHASE2 domain-containing sensor protein